MSRTIRLILVEDDEYVVSYLTDVINSSDDMQLIAVFGSAEDFDAAFMDLSVDVVLMDIQLPGKSGIQSVAKWKPRKPEVQFMMCTILEDEEKIFDSLCLGATGYLVKGESAETILNAIHEIYQGGSPMSAKIARKVVQSFQSKKTDSTLTEQLTKREWEILQLLDKGFRYKEIADQLSNSIKTVRSTVRDIYRKLEVHSRTDALNKIFKSSL